MEPQIRADGTCHCNKSSRILFRRFSRGEENLLCPVCHSDSPRRSRRRSVKDYLVGSDTAAPLALPGLRLALLCLGGSHRLCLVRALRNVRQHGLAAHFQRARDGHVRLGVSPVSRSRLSLRPLPESLFLISDLPPHRAHAATRRTQSGISSRPALASVFPLRTCRKPKIDFHFANV